jgi:CBS domain containing-hemolysin-like protein
MNYLLIILVSLLFSAFFSGMEIAFISSNRLRIELYKKQETFSSGIISVFVKQPGKYLTTMLVGNNIALVTYGWVMAIILEPVISRFSDSPVTILLIQTIISTMLILVTAEFLPKMIFRSNANTMLNIFSFPVFVFYILFYPLTTFINWISHTIINSFHKDENENIETKQVFNKVDLLHLINQVHEIKGEEETTGNDLKLFQNALDFSSVKVRDCMVPRTEIVAIEIGGSLDELQQKFIETGFSKILVYQDSPDNMIGYITSKSLFKKQNSIKSNVIETVYVPETMPAKRLFEKFAQDKRSLAVVVDEFGGVSGIVTIEDIIEEIFGEIEDEHDTVELIEKQINDEEYIFSGRLEIDYLNDKYNLKIPESEDYETLAGFIVHYFESIPKLNERIRIEPFEIKILKVSKTKIDLVHLKALAE